MNLPVEIIWFIIRIATCVPAAFDTSFDASIGEDVSAVTNAIQESMKTKLALSLVSRSFHDIVIEFLYEIVTLHELRWVKTLVSLLHTNRADKQCRGWWCRRLQITVGEEHEEYSGDTWLEGRHTLWGLIPACPRLIVLLCAVRFNAEFMRQTPTGCRIPRTMFQLIASKYSQTLRRMEIYGNTTTRLDMMALVLKTCTAMEVFRIEELEGQWPVYDSPNESCHDEADDEGIDAVDAETLIQCRLARDNARWTTTTVRQKVTLSNLHTLEIYPFNLSQETLSFPALRRVGARLDVMTHTEASLAILDKGLADIYPNLTHVGYWGPTHVLSDVLGRFPNMEDLVFGATPPYNLAMFISFHHAKLSSISLTGNHYYSFVPKYLSAIANVASDGLLPSLRKVRVWECDEKEIDPIRISRFTRLGIALEFTYDSQNRFLQLVPFIQAFYLR
jgi:hypothetical protein